jgi:predicted oxidoreductase
VTANDGFTNGDVAFHQMNNTPMMAWSPLGGGSLFSNPNSAIAQTLNAVAQRNNVDIAAVAVGWLLAHPSKILPVMGTNNLDRIKTLSQAMGVSIDRQTWFEIYTAALGREVA